jgi:hypothetical protein
MGSSLGMPSIFYPFLQVLLKHNLQLMHPSDTFHAVLPDTMHFTELLKVKPPRGISLRRKSTELVIPNSHLSHSNAQPSPSRGISHQYAIYLKPHNDSGKHEHEDQHHIKMLLDNLHSRFPAFDFPQYEDRLQKQGIHYLIVASMFDANFYMADVGMVPGAARLFKYSVEKALDEKALEGM